MKNFKDAEWEHLTEDELFVQYMKYVPMTIEKQFPNHRQFCKAHMIDYEDLVQMGNIGLLNAIRSYNPSSNVKFTTHLINHIFWEITVQSKRASLRNINTQSFDLVNLVSADAETNASHSDDEDINLLDRISIPPSQETSEIANDSILFQEVIEFLRKDPEMTPDLLFIFTRLLQGESCATIAKQTGTHRNTVAQRLRRKKAIRIKERLYKFLKEEQLIMKGVK